MESLTSQQKVAETLLVLSPKQAAEVLKPLDERELLFTGEALLKYARRPAIPVTKTSNNSEENNNDSEALAKNQNTFLRLTARDFSEIEVVRALFKLAFGEKKAQDLVKKLLRINVKNKLSFLNSHTTEHLFMSLREESIAVIGLVISVIKPHLAAQVLQLLDTEKRLAVIKRVAIQQNPTSQTVNIVETVLRERLNKIVQEEQSKEVVNGEDNFVQILKHLSSQEQERLLASIDDASMKERMRMKLFSWDSLNELSQSEIERLLADFSDKELAKLIIVEGDPAIVQLKLSLSKNRMLLIEDEIVLIKKDFHSQVYELKNVMEIKKRFHTTLKQYLPFETSFKKA